MADPRLMALQQAMSGMGETAGPMPGGGEPMPPEMAPEAAAPAGDEAGAVQQALELLTPFAQSNEMIAEALVVLEQSLGGPSGDVPEDTDMMDQEMPLGA